MTDGTAEYRGNRLPYVSYKGLVDGLTSELEKHKDLLILDLWVATDKEVLLTVTDANATERVPLRISIPES